MIIRWNTPGDPLYGYHRGVTSVRRMVDLLPETPSTVSWSSPMYWRAPGAQPGPWRWLQPSVFILDEWTERVEVSHELDVPMREEPLLPDEVRRPADIEHAAPPERAA